MVRHALAHCYRCSARSGTRRVSQQGATLWCRFGVSFTNVLVALSMAEIVSAYPCAGGPYCW